MYKYLSKNLFSFLGGIYPEVELLNHRVILFLIFFGGMPCCFPQGIWHVIVPTGHERFQFLHVLTNTCCYYFDSSHSNGREVVAKMVLIHTPLND